MSHTDKPFKFPKVPHAVWRVMFWDGEEWLQHGRDFDTRLAANEFAETVECEDDCIGIYMKRTQQAFAYGREARAWE